MNLWNPNTDFFDNYYDKGKYKFAWRLSILFTFVFGVLSGLFLFLNTTATLFYFAVFIIAILTTTYLHFTKKFNVVFWSFIVTASLLVTLSLNIIVDTAHYSDLLWIIAIILFGYVALNRIVGILFTVLHCINIFFYFYFTFNKHVNELRNQEGLELLGVAIEVALGLIVITYLISEYLKFQEYAKNELQQKNKELQQHIKIIDAKSHENEVLLKEVHHRVKNNLQIIISMLRMQMDELQTPESIDQFNQAINRIMAISLIHQRLYQFDDLSQVEAKIYLKDLSETIRESARLDVDVDIEINAPTIVIDLETIVPIGLLINELLLNSFKHAFKANQQGHICIDLKEDDGTFKLHYFDSGVWKESDSVGFGTQLVDALTEQMNGEYSRSESEFTFHLRPMVGI